VFALPYSEQCARLYEVGLALLPRLLAAPHEYTELWQQSEQHADVTETQVRRYLSFFLLLLVLFLCFYLASSIPDSVRAGTHRRSVDTGGALV
jgi:hypothetical protein